MMTTFRKKDEGVSPVIAVILMVAITVVLAATVYVWVSSFSAGNGPAPSMTLSQMGSATNNNVTLTVASASPNLAWNDLRFALDGTTLTYADLAAGAASADRYCVITSGACAAVVPTNDVNAGQRLVIQHTGALAGGVLTVSDTATNTAIISLTLH